MINKRTVYSRTEESGNRLSVTDGERKATSKQGTVEI
jgi:hypothetical protein